MTTHPAADQRLEAAVRDAVTTIREVRRNDPAYLDEIGLPLAAYILTAATHQVEWRLGAEPRGYAQTFQVGRP